MGFERDPLLAGIQDPSVKQRLTNEIEATITRGVFGSPFFFMGGEPFWGSDRIELLYGSLKNRHNLRADLV